MPRGHDDRAAIETLRDVFGLQKRSDDLVGSQLAGLEAHVRQAARRIDELEARVARQEPMAHVPSDRAGLLRLKAEIEARLAVYDAGSAITAELLSTVPLRRGAFVGYRVVRGNVSVAPLRSAPFPSRFSDGSTSVLYVALDAATAIFEMDAAVVRAGLPASFLSEDAVCVVVRVRSEMMLDLTDLTTRMAIEAVAPGAIDAITIGQEMQASQEFGRILDAIGIDACLYPSRASIGRRRAVIFPRNLRHPSDLIVQDGPTRLRRD